MIITKTEWSVYTWQYKCRTRKGWNKIKNACRLLGLYFRAYWSRGKYGMKVYFVEVHNFGPGFPYSKD